MDDGKIPVEIPHTLTKKVGRRGKLASFLARHGPKMKPIGTAFGKGINFLRNRHKMSTKTTTARKTTKKETVAETAPVAAVAAPVVAAPGAAAPVTAAPAEVEEVNVVAEFNGLVAKVSTLRETLAGVFSEMKKLEKRIPRELKKASKGRRNRKSADGVEKPKKESVFTKPTKISDDLCVFLGKPKGTLLSRSQVTTEVCAYARTKSLMDKQVIKADAALRKLLKITEKDELKILNLQKYLKPHYIKDAPVA